MSEPLDPRPESPAEDGLAGPGRPLGIRLLTSLFWFWAGALVLLVMALGFGEGPVILRGRSVRRAEALTRVLPALLPMGLAVVGAALALAQARRWARAAALFPFALAAFTPSLAGLGDRTAAGLLVSLLVVAPVIAGLVWYLYFRPGPRAYFSERHPER